MKKWIDKVMAIVIALTLTVGLIPAVEVIAETSNATVSNLGSLGTVEIGTKTESGTWYQTKVGDKAAFCMDLGLACHSGDTYESETDTYSSDSKNTRKSLEAYVGYWYDQTKQQSRKAWVYAQCLIWSIEEGYTSKSNLTEVIRQVRSNTGYYNNKTAAELYKEIFEISGTVECEVSIWKYSGSGASRQELLQIKTRTRDYPYSEINDTKLYRQRITIDKTDEFGNAVPHVSFEVSAGNCKELYAFKYNGWGSAETGSGDGDSVFNAVAETAANGRITFKFTYQIQSEDYAYVKKADLDKMTADDKKAMKEKMDDDGFKYANNLTKAGAEELVEKDLQKQINNISNQYVVKEISSGNNNLIINSEYINGKTVTITSSGSWTKVDGEWPETADGTYGDYSKATQLDIVNKYKKASLDVRKNDDYATDGKAHGEATLDGAEYRLYSDPACTQLATVYNANGTTKTAGTYTVQNGAFSTDYLCCGINYYLKEYKAPTGYQINTKVYTICQNGANLTAEYTPNASTVNVYETPYTGQIAIKKVSSRSVEDTVNEEGAKFQIYLKSKGSYENASGYDRCIITTDKNGYGISQKLYKGAYVVHQIANGTLNGKEVDLIQCDDFEVTISGDGTVPVYEYTINNPRFKAFLKVIKKDKRTDKTILKAGTAYQIRHYDDDNDTWNPVTQTFINDGNVETADTFICNENGEIMTYAPLESGTYRIYETDSVTGTYRDTEYVEIVIHQSKKDNYDSLTDSDGNIHLVVNIKYINDETKGKFTLDKRGFELTSFVPEKGFSYESVAMPDTTFEVYAKENIVTQDNQGTYWFEKGELVATIISGKNVEFTDDCNGICTYNIENDGSTTLYFPLGKYELKEVKTLYSYFLPEVKTWDLEFTWNNQDEEYVFNTTDVTDKEGILSVQNELVQTDISIFKPDKDTNKPVKDTVFGFYSRDNIYNAEGKIIVKAGEKIATVTTNEEGVAKVPFDIPLMSKGYKVTDENVTEETTEKATEKATEEATTLETETADNSEEDLTENENAGLNSGNYYWKEEGVSGSYYPDSAEIDVHLEYKDQDTSKIISLSELANKQTDVSISKVALADSNELSYCDLDISDINGNLIINWTSGVSDSIVVTEKAEELGYRNMTATMDDKGNLIVKGLLHDEEYKLTETKPCDGYATAESINFMLKQGADEQGNVITKANVKDENGNFVEKPENKILMYDDTIKVEFFKYATNTDKLLPGTKWKVFDEEGNEVYSFTTKDKSAFIEGVFIAGETYRFVETKTVKGYELAEEFTYKVKDTGDVQVIECTNRYMPGKIITETPDDFRDGSLTSPKTGRPDMGVFMTFILALCVAITAWRKKDEVED